jgi:hypothetical protein
VVALLLLTILPHTALARDPAVDQYVESVPGPGGDRPAGSEPQPGGAALPPAVREQIRSEGGDDAAALTNVASSPALGAPKPSRRASESGAARPDSSPSALDAVTSTATGDSGAGAWLIGGLAVLTAALAVTVLTRRRSLDGS